MGRAADAAQAIDLGRRHRPDLALLDLNLADGLTGPRIAKTLVHERLATVVFVTGQANVLPSDLHGAFGSSRSSKMLLRSETSSSQDRTTASRR